MTCSASTSPGRLGATVRAQRVTSVPPGCLTRDPAPSHQIPSAHAHASTRDRERFRLAPVERFIRRDTGTSDSLPLPPSPISTEPEAKDKAPLPLPCNQHYHRFLQLPALPTTGGEPALAGNRRTNPCEYSGPLATRVRPQRLAHLQRWARTHRRRYRPGPGGTRDDSLSSRPRQGQEASAKEANRTQYGLAPVSFADTISATYWRLVERRTEPS